MPRAPASIQAKALALVAQREHSRVELKRKLLAHAARRQRAEADLSEAASQQPAEEAGAAPSTDVDCESHADVEGEIERVLDWLTDKDLISTARFIESRVAARAPRRGDLRIRHELAEHGVALDAATAAALKSTELQRAHAVWAKRFGTLAADAAERAKQMRFLAARGFSAEVVRRVVAGRAE